MSDRISIEKCQTYIDCNLHAPHAKQARDARVHRPAVTLSRQTGAGGMAVADALAGWLQARAPRGACPWTVFDKNLVQKVLEDHNLPARLAQFMPEDKVSGIADAMEEILGLHPASWKLVRQTSETIFKLAELGHAILLGRGGNIITRRLESVIHVRLVAAPDSRANRIMEVHKISRAAARAFIRKEDAGRARYLRKYFGQEIEDPLLYHLVINTDYVPVGEAVELIGQAVLRVRG
jgi:cytidylate kinase